MADFCVSFNYTYPTLRFISDDAPVGFNMTDFCEWLIKMKEETTRPSLVVPLSNETFADIEWKDCMYDFENGLYCFRLKKLRSKNIPAFTGKNVDSTDIVLEENQFLGEFNLLVFDPHIGKLIVQSNYFGLSIKQIETALTQMRLKYFESKGEYVDSNDPGFVKLEFLVDPKEITSLRESDIYRSINLRVADISRLETMQIKSTTLNKAVELANDMEGIAVTIQVSLSHEPKARSLNNVEMNELIEDIEKLNINQNEGTKLSVKARNSIESPLENIDVLLPKLTSTVVLHDMGRATLGMEYLYTQFKEQNYFSEEQHMQRRAKLLSPA